MHNVRMYSACSVCMYIYFNEWRSVRVLVRLGMDGLINCCIYICMYVCISTGSQNGPQKRVNPILSFLDKAAMDLNLGSVDRLWKKSVPPNT